VYNLISNRRILMQNLINELTQPRLSAPTAVMLRAGKVLKELFDIHQADLKGRLDAEQKLTVALDEIERLTNELRSVNEKINSNSSSSATPNTSPSDP
jgi:hypothetical protein